VVELQDRQRIGDEQRSPTRFLHQYLDRAEHFALELGRPVLWIVGGLMGTGKSTLAQELAESLEADLLSTDKIRRSLFGNSVTAAGYGQGNYRSDHRQTVYDELFDRAAAALDRGRSAILDGSFLKQELRRYALELGRRRGATPLFIQCHCPKQTALSRIERRVHDQTAVSEARVDLYDEQAQECEPLTDGDSMLRIDTERSLSDQIQQVYRESRRLEERDSNRSSQLAK
jgi:uncharacterized protein